MWQVNQEWKDFEFMIGQDGSQGGWKGNQKLDYAKPYIAAYGIWLLFWSQMFPNFSAYKQYPDKRL